MRSIRRPLRVVKTRSWGHGPLGDARSYSVIRWGFYRAYREIGEFETLQCATGQRGHAVQAWTARRMLLA
jgi:hypothetical protein